MANGMPTPSSLVKKRFVSPDWRKKQGKKTRQNVSRIPLGPQIPVPSIPSAHSFF
jgi:hypothetical protein